MPLDDVFAYFGSYDKESYRVMACQGNEPSEDDVAAFEATVGFCLPEEFRAFTMSPLGGLYLEVLEALWRRPKEFDVGPFWSFLYGIKVFGIAEGIPELLDIRVQHQEMKEAGVDGLVPFLQLIGDADCFCFNAMGDIVQWSHEDPAEHPIIDRTFSELLMDEIQNLEIRKECKINNEDIQDYHERVNDHIFVSSKVKVFLEQAPASVKTLLLIKNSLGLQMSIGELKRAAEAAPCVIAEGLTYIQAINKCETVIGVDACLGIRLARDDSRKLPVDRDQMDDIVQ